MLPENSVWPTDTELTIKSQQIRKVVNTLGGQPPAKCAYIKDDDLHQEGIAHNCFLLPLLWGVKSAGRSGTFMMMSLEIFRILFSSPKTHSCNSRSTGIKGNEQ